MENKIISRKDILISLKSFLMKLPSELELKFTVNIDFVVFITGPEKSVANGTSLRTYLIRQVFQKLHPQLATEVKHFL